MTSNPQQFQEQVLPRLEDQVDISQKCTKILSNSLTVVYKTVLSPHQNSETLFNL